MKQRKLPHQLFAPATAPPDISISPPLAPAMMIFPIRKSSRQRCIYTYIPSNAETPLTVKERYICPGVLGGALCNGPAYGSNAKKALHPRRRLEP
jgi:hypothetical protein